MSMPYHWSNSTAAKKNFPISGDGVDISSRVGYKNGYVPD